MKHNSLLKPLCSDNCYFDVWVTCRYFGYTFYKTILQVLDFLFGNLNRNLGILFSPFIIYITVGQVPFWLFKGLPLKFLFPVLFVMMCSLLYHSWIRSKLDNENMIGFFSTDDTAADSTQDPNTKETKQTFPAETSSIEPAESSSSSVAPPEKDSDLVGSTVNGNNTVTAKHQEAEMIPESSSEAQEKPETPVVSSMEAEPSSLASSALEPSTQALSSEEVYLEDSNYMNKVHVILLLRNLMLLHIPKVIYFIYTVYRWPLRHLKEDHEVVRLSLY